MSPTPGAKISSRPRSQYPSQKCIEFFKAGSSFLLMAFKKGGHATLKQYIYMRPANGGLNHPSSTFT
jgi:hypothetical protein